MFCTQCGKEVQQGSRFCSACGATVAAVPDNNSEADAFGQNAGAAPPPQPGVGVPPPYTGSSFFTPRTAKLVRPRSPRAIAGVCAAFALHFGWDLVLVRIVVAVFALFWGVGLLAYLICWVAIPDGQYALPPQSTYR